MRFSILLLLGSICESQIQNPKRCNVAYDCSYEESPVWTSRSGQFCEVFRNECLMLSENCDRLNANRPETIKITKRKCQEMCRSQVCLKCYKPICGIYNGRKRTFGNGCEMSKHICTTGQTFILQNRGVCS